jgi:hypothetical protein
MVIIRRCDMAQTVTKLVVTAEVGPLQRSTSTVYVHDVELEGDENLQVGDRVEVRDEGGGLWAATVEAVTRDELGRRYQLSLRP